MIASQITQLVLMSTFIFYYIRSAVYDAPMTLPTVMMDRRDWFVCSMSLLPFVTTVVPIPPVLDTPKIELR